MSESPGTTRIHWRNSYRIVSSRFPPSGLFDTVADPADLEAVMQLEGLTNERLREQLGQLRRLPAERRISGPGTTPVMSAFVHVNRAGSRFSDGSHGVYYAAHRRQTAIEETVHHRQRFLAATAHPATHLEMRCYVAEVRALLHDVRGGWPEVHDPASYVASRKLATRLRGGGGNGLVYDSVRDPGGQCVALFYPDCVRRCRQGEHLIYRWNGERIASVLVASEAIERPAAAGGRVA